MAIVLDRLDLRYKPPAIDDQPTFQTLSINNNDYQNTKTLCHDYNKSIISFDHLITIPNARELFVRATTRFKPKDY